MVAYFHISMSCTKQLLKSTGNSHDNSVCDVIIVHVISGDAQTNRPTKRCGKRKAISPLSADVSGAVVLVAAALAAVAAAALRIAVHEVWHLAFAFLLVMEFHLPFSSSPLLPGSLCLRCTKDNGERRWLWFSCFWFLLPSDCLRSVVKES